MFSGIVEAIARVTAVREAHGQRFVSIARPRGWKMREGESVAVEGVCSTVQRNNGRVFEIAYMPETLRRTTLGGIERGSRVNLERSAKLSSRIGGHWVQGHVDATGRIRSVRAEGEARIYEFEIPAQFSRYIVEKGSIAVDGISLTVVRTRRGRFSVSLLAYTMEKTTLGAKRPGARVNIETDILAKYTEKLMKR